MSSMARFTFIVIFCLISSCLVHGSSHKKNDTSKASHKKVDILVETCQLCAKNNPNVDHTYCVETLGSVPKSHHVDRKGLALIALILAESDAKDVYAKVKKLLKAKPLSTHTETRLETCREHYSSAISKLKESIEAIKSSQHEKVKASISKAVDAPSDCEKGFKDGEGASSSSPLAKENSEFLKHATLALALTALE